MLGIRNASISAKFGLGFGAALAFIVIGGAVGLHQLRAVNQATVNLIDERLPRIEMLGALKQASSKHWLLAARRLRTANFRDLDTINRGMASAQAEIGAAHQAYSGRVISVEESRILEEFHALWADYLATLRVIYQRVEAGDILAAIQEFNSVSTDAFERANGKLAQLAGHAKTNTEAAVREATGTYRAAWLLTVAAIVFSALCVVATMLWLSRNISSPILRVSEAMRRLTQGDHSVVIEDDPNRGDEIGTLISAARGYRLSLLRSRSLGMQAKLEKERLDAAIANMPHGLCMFDAEGRVVLFNHRYAEMMGVPTETLAGRSLLDLFQARKESGDFDGDPEEITASVMAEVKTGRSFTKFMATPKGTTLRVIDNPMPDGGWIGTFEDITEQRAAQAKISHMALHDALTGLPNRLLFREHLEARLNHLGRDQKCAILCFDLDRFKNVNDTLGHPFGDKLLRQVAERVGKCLRDDDTLARLGGDEFAILQAHVEQAESTSALAARLIEQLGAPFDLDGQEVVIGVSIGIAMAPIDATEPDKLLKSADMALYRAKAEGRGTYRFFEPEMDRLMQARRTLEVDLRKAIVNREFEIHYQPLINLHTEKVCGFEGLLRWNHPTRGMIGPLDFISLAEETGLIVPIGEWVIRTACDEAAKWPREISLAINLSPAQFKIRTLTQMVLSALAHSGLAAQRLELEITEAVLLVDNSTTLETLHQLRGLGVKISMDDFGTGYSSLSYLRSFPFDKIKIDRSFVHDLQANEDSKAIVRAVTGLGTSLGMATTGEGVETREEAEYLRLEGCTEAQGFLYSKPRPAADVMDMLAAHNGVVAAVA